MGTERVIINTSLISMLQVMQALESSTQMPIVFTRSLTAEKGIPRNSTGKASSRLSVQSWTGLCPSKPAELHGLKRVWLCLGLYSKWLFRWRKSHLSQSMFSDWRDFLQPKVGFMPCYCFPCFCSNSSLGRRTSLVALPYLSQRWSWNAGLRSKV